MRVDLKLKNVASIELGSNSYNVSATQNSQAMVPIGINLQSGANALQTANLVKEKMKELNLSFPKDMTYNIPYDTTRFIEISIKEKRELDGTILNSIKKNLQSNSYIIYVFGINNKRSKTEQLTTWSMRPPIILMRRLR